MWYYTQRQSDGAGNFLLSQRVRKSTQSSNRQLNALALDGVVAVMFVYTHLCVPVLIFSQYQRCYDSFR